MRRMEGGSEEPDVERGGETAETNDGTEKKNDRIEGLREDLTRKLDAQEARKSDREEFQSGYDQKSVNELKESDPKEYERTMAANKMATREEIDDAQGGETCWDSMSAKDKMEMLQSNPERGKALQQDYEDRHPYGLDSEDQTPYMQDMKHENQALHKQERDNNEGIPEDMLESDNPYKAFARDDAEEAPDGADKQADAPEGDELEQPEEAEEAEQPEGAEEAEEAETEQPEISDEEIEANIKAYENGENPSEDFDDMTQEDQKQYLDELWDDDSGLTYDVHKQYDDKLEEAKEQAENAETDEERAMAEEKAEQLQDAIDDYNETGIEQQPIYPEENGFYGETRRETFVGTAESDESPQIISRYDVSGAEHGSGRFASPNGTDYESRAMPYDESKKEEHFYRVEEGAKVEVTAGEAKDFHNDTGTGGTQYQFDRPIKDYVRDGQMYECDQNGNRLEPKEDDPDAQTDA